MKSNWRICISVVGGILIILNIITVVTRYDYLEANFTYSVIESCLTLTWFSIPIIAFGFLSGGCFILASKDEVDLRSIIQSVVCFVIGAVALAVTIGNVDVCARIGL